MDRIAKQKINKNIADLNNGIKQLDSIEIHRTFHLTTME